MEAVIKIKPSELTKDFYKRLKTLVKDSVLLTIRIDTVTEREIELSGRIDQLNEGKVQIFSMEELESFVASK